MSYELRRGELLEIDVLGKDAIHFTMTSRRGTYHRMPSVCVQEEYTGFTATIQSIALISSKAGSDQVVDDMYEITVSWTPGGDQSGAFISVTYPDSDEEARAHIYMMGP